MAGRGHSALGTHSSLITNTLVSLTPTDPASATYWATYRTNWTAWNTARTLASLTAGTLFTLALRL